MKELTNYGKEVKKKLVEHNMTQEELIKKIKTVLPNRYVDGSLLNKIFSGVVKDSAIIPIINNILDITITNS